MFVEGTDKKKCIAKAKLPQKNLKQKYETLPAKIVKKCSFGTEISRSIFIGIKTANILLKKKFIELVIRNLMERVRAWFFPLIFSQFKKHCSFTV